MHFKKFYFEVHILQKSCEKHMKTSHMTLTYISHMLAFLIALTLTLSVSLSSSSSHHVCFGMSKLHMPYTVTV